MKQRSLATAFGSGSSPGFTPDWTKSPAKWLSEDSHEATANRGSCPFSRVVGSIDTSDFALQNFAHAAELSQSLTAGLYCPDPARKRRSSLQSSSDRHRPVFLRCLLALHLIVSTPKVNGCLPPEVGLFPAGRFDRYLESLRRRVAGRRPIVMRIGPISAALDF
jgi:hypothetical protein